MRVVVPILVRSLAIVEIDEHVGQELVQPVVNELFVHGLGARF